MKYENISNFRQAQNFFLLDTVVEVNYRRYIDKYTDKQI